MSYVGNSPAAETILRVEARKSFALGLRIKDKNGNALDISNATFRIVVKKFPSRTGDPADDDNLVENAQAAIIDGPAGVAQFNLQASDLNLSPLEYAYAVVMWFEGYSAVIVKGVLDVRPNTEFASVGQTYTGQNPPESLLLHMEGPRVLQVYTGAVLAPGTTSFTDEDKRKLDTVEEGAQKNPPNLIPAGGARRAYLGKAGDQDFALAWFQPPQVDPSGLDADGITLGFVPTANGFGGWDWMASVSSADDITDGVNKVVMTVAERTKLGSLTKDYNQLQNLPTLGSAAAQDVNAFLPSTGIDGNKITTGVVAKERLPRLSGHLGFGSGTASPTGGLDGDIYYQHEA